MKLVKNILESVKPLFVKGGKLEKMYPAYDAFETFLFVPDHTTKSGSHIRDALEHLFKIPVIIPFTNLGYTIEHLQMKKLDIIIVQLL